MYKYGILYFTQRTYTVNSSGVSSVKYVRRIVNDSVTYDDALSIAEKARESLGDKVKAIDAHFQWHAHPEIL